MNIKIFNEFIYVIDIELEGKIDDFIEVASKNDLLFRIKIVSIGKKKLKIELYLYGSLFNYRKFCKEVKNIIDIDVTD